MRRSETNEQIAAFESWYAGKRTFGTIRNDAQRSKSTYFRWSETFDWHTRADIRDQAARKKAEAAALDRTAEFLKAQQQAGQLLRLRGLETIANRSRLLDERTAVAAIKCGIDLERQAIGLHDHVVHEAAPDALELLRSFLACGAANDGE